MRQRYFVVVSGLYVALGVIILARSLVAHVIPLVILGLIFIALGIVRIRTYRKQGEERT